MTMTDKPRCTGTVPCPVHYWRTRPPEEPSRLAPFYPKRERSRIDELREAAWREKHLR